jgi:hypothetical protein
MTEYSSQPLRPFFILGDTWCFYKFYTGPKSADLLLTQVLAPAPPSCRPGALLIPGSSSATAIRVPTCACACASANPDIIML